jgi:phage-related protein
MPLDLPANMNQDLATSNTGGAWMWLVEIAVPNYNTKRLARNTEEVEYASNFYEADNIEVGQQVLSGDGSIPRITLRVSQNANKVLETIINETEGAYGTEVKLIKVNSNYLDESIPALEADYDMLICESDSDWVTFTLGIPNSLTQRYPLRTQMADSCPYATPELFKGPRCQYTGLETNCEGTLEDCRSKGNAEHFGGEIGVDANVTQS